MRNRGGTNLDRNGGRNAFVDISVTVRSGMVHWPGDPAIRISDISSIRGGDEANVSRIDMGSHTGTHMDAPHHFIEKGRGIDRMPLDATVGKARIIEIRDHVSIRPEELRGHRIRRGERILFKTRNSSRRWARGTFRRDFVFISVAAAEFLAERGVRLVGVDYLSVGGYKKDGAATHRALLRAGIWIIEGLDLSRVTEGEYELLCLPLKLHHGDGAPARAVVRRLQSQ